MSVSVHDKLLFSCVNYLKDTKGAFSSGVD